MEEALEEGRPDDTILMQTQADINLGNHHRKRHSKRSGVRDQPPYIYPKKEAADWFELDNMDERIHGSNRFEETDDMSPHDPEVADAPEDMKRAGDLGNDHEELHNAKLGPDGYYTGFFHKDFEGKFAQQRHHHHRR